MKQYYRKLDEILALLLVSGISLEASAAIKCWTNKDGVRECGNSVPAEYAQQGHTTFNAQGVAVGEKKRAKSLEEFAEEQRQKEQKAIADKKRQAAEKADRVLLDTFSSEDDLVLAREGKVSAIEAQIQLTESHIEKIQANLDRMIAVAADLERRGQKPAEQATADMEKARAQIAENRAFIEAKRSEQEAVRQQYAADIQRFKKLTGNE